MTDANGKGGRDYTDSAWKALDHEGALRVEGRRFRPAKTYDRPQLSERDAACQPQHSMWEIWTRTQPGVVVGKSHATRPGRASPAKRQGGKERQADLFK